MGGAKGGGHCISKLLPRVGEIPERGGNGPGKEEGYPQRTNSLILKQDIKGGRDKGRSRGKMARLFTKP